MSFLKLPSVRNGLTIRHEDILPLSAIDRRTESVRTMMQRLDIDVLMIYGNGVVQGPVCYLTDYPSYRLGRRAVTVLSRREGPFLFTADPSRNVPKVRHFTACDLEGSRIFFAKACKKALELAGNGTLGLVGREILPLALAESMEKELSPLKILDVSPDFVPIMAAKDESSFKATMQALRLAESSLDILKEELSSGKDLWRLAALIDYRLRLQGCENTNILLNCGADAPIRPAYPPRLSPGAGDAVLAYIAVQYARHWGLVGRTLAVGPPSQDLKNKLARLGESRERIASAVKPGMTLGQVETIIGEAGKMQGFDLASDIPLARGVGFDPEEYPQKTTDTVHNDMVLQVVLCSDFAGETTGWFADMLQITETGGNWVSGLDTINP